MGYGLRVVGLQRLVTDIQKSGGILDRLCHIARVFVLRPQVERIKRVGIVERITGMVAVGPPVIKQHNSRKAAFAIWA